MSYFSGRDVLVSVESPAVTFKVAGSDDTYAFDLADTRQSVAASMRSVLEYCELETDSCPDGFPTSYLAAIDDLETILP